MESLNFSCFFNKLHKLLPSIFHFQLKEYLCRCFKINFKGQCRGISSSLEKTSKYKFLNCFRWFLILKHTNSTTESLLKHLKTKFFQFLLCPCLFFFSPGISLATSLLVKPIQRKHFFRPLSKPNLPLQKRTNASSVLTESSFNFFFRTLTNRRELTDY